MGSSATPLTHQHMRMDGVLTVAVCKVHDLRERLREGVMLAIKNAAGPSIYFRSQVDLNWLVRLAY